MAQIKTCRWVLAKVVGEPVAQCCGKPTRYRMGEDEDGSRHRQHDVWCEEHAAQVKQLLDAAEEG